MNQINEYDTCCNMGRGVKPPHNRQCTRIHFVFDVNHDLCCKSPLIAGGHMTAPPKRQHLFLRCYSQIPRLCVFLGELDGLDTSVTDVGNAYPMAFTKENKLYIILGPEFGAPPGCQFSL